MRNRIFATHKFRIIPFFYLIFFTGCVFGKSELDEFILDGASDLGFKSNLGYEEVYFKVNAKYPAHKESDEVDNLMLDRGYLPCISSIPEWQSYQDLSSNLVIFNKQVVGVNEEINSLIIFVFSYREKSYSLRAPSSDDMYISIQKLIFKNKKEIKKGLDLIMATCQFK